MTEAFKASIGFLGEEGVGGVYDHTNLILIDWYLIDMFDWQDEDDADLTEAFKASIGLLGEEGVGGVDEITWQMDEERDQTISRLIFFTI